MIKDATHLNLLVIEDNDGDYTLIEDYLNDQFSNLEITHVYDFSSAREYLSNPAEHFDVILLDLSLPDKSGEELVTEIRNLNTEGLVIVLTGYGDFDFTIRSLSLGVADYLLKDELSASGLYKSIIYNIERKKTNQRLAESEKRFSSIFDLSPQPMWVFDTSNLQFVQVNQAAIRKYGYSEEEFLRMSILELHPEEDWPKVRETVIRVNKDPNIPFSGRFRHITRLGQLIEAESYSSTIQLNNSLYRSVIAIDVTEKLLFENKITRAIIKTQEDERYEIGGELHDNVCQILSTAQMHVEMMKESLSPAGIVWFDQSKKYLKLALDEIRNLSHRLAPAFFDDSTLEESFRMLLATFNSAGKYEMSIYFDQNLSSYILSRDIQINLYRILQEQLRNISKYAEATKLSVSVKCIDQNLLMEISDNGNGFDKSQQPTGIGFANMKRRAEVFSGMIEVISSPGNGCTIAVQIPLEELHHTVEPLID